MTGQCTCKTGVTGINCDVCRDGFHSFSANGCQACSCSEVGSVNNSCSPNGVCSCLSRFTGDLCDRCDVGFFNFSGGCLSCNCNNFGTLDGQSLLCNTTTGQCSCKLNVQGRSCDTCVTGFTDLQDSNQLGCSPCDCVLGNTNSSGTLCHPVSSQCSCLSYATGLRCESCRDVFYPNVSGTCIPCQCNGLGSINATCSNSGQCFCNMTSGRTCSTCALGQYGFPK